MSNHRLSLAQQIAELEEPAPVDVDPEDDRAGSPAPFEGAAEAREHYVEVGPSALRRMQDSVADPKYEGVKTSRRQLMEESEPEEGDEDEEGLSVQDRGSMQRSGGEDEEEEAGPVQSAQEDEDESEEDETRPLPVKRSEIAENAGVAEDISSTLRQKREEDRKKGQAVSRQLSLWDSLLDARIRLQKSVVAANRLPKPSQLLEFISNPSCLEAQHALLAEAVSLCDELSLLREDLMVQEEVRPRKRRRVGEAVAEIDGEDRDWEALVGEVGADAAGLEHAYHAHLTHTLAKWSAKIAAVAPSALLPSSRSAFSGGKTGVKTVGAQVDETLQGDGAKLLARTRIRRGKGARVVVQTTAEGEDMVAADADGEDIELFDDTDFYQQLLRDVIDTRGAGTGAGDDWMAAQRQKKAKKSVDTKASKGRKIRYEVHEKIQNFMVPVPLAGGGWHEAQIDELFASLLGQGFERTGGGGDEMEDIVPTGGVSAEPSADVLKGFRVFG